MLEGQPAVVGKQGIGRDIFHNDRLASKGRGATGAGDRPDRLTIDRFGIGFRQTRRGYVAQMDTVNIQQQDGREHAEALLLDNVNQHIESLVQGFAFRDQFVDQQMQRDLLLRLSQSVVERAEPAVRFPVDAAEVVAGRIRAVVGEFGRVILAPAAVVAGQAGGWSSPANAVCRRVSVIVLSARALQTLEGGPDGVGEPEQADRSRACVRADHRPERRVHLDRRLRP